MARSRGLSLRAAAPSGCLLKSDRRSADPPAVSNEAASRDHPLRDQDGFTLVELLVVVVIVGILAAIAIPVFLGQRQKGYASAAKSDLRNLASFEEIFLSDTGTYGTISAVRAAEPRFLVSPGVTVRVVRYDGVNGYCLSASHSATPVTWYWDSQGGGLQPQGSGGCPATTSGTPGDSVTG